MTGHIYSAAYITVFLAGFIAMGVAVVNFGGMVTQVRPERRTIAHFVAPLLLVLPGMLTEHGNGCRRRFWMFLFIAVICVGALYMMESMYGKPPYMAELNKQ